MKKHLALYSVLIIFALFLSVFAGAYSNLMRYRFGILNANESLSWKTLVAVASTYDAALMVFNSLSATFDSAPIRIDSPLEDIRLRVPAGAIKEMASGLPKSAKAKYYKSKLLYPDNKWQKIDFRFRGRNIWHWHTDKPSLRLKLKKSRPLDLQRHINLVNPEDLSMVANYYGELLGQRLGVLTHKTSMVRLFINNAYYGVYQKTTREDENMLRLNKRIPGPLYVGNYLRRTWQTDQFDLEGELKILDTIDPMSPVIDAINNRTGPKRFEQLWAYMDKEKLAAWLSLMNLSGNIHTDFKHNHIYYFDPSKGKIEPIVSDILGLGTLLYPGAKARLTNEYTPSHTLPINEKLQPLLDAALRDPTFYHERNKILFKALRGAASTQEQYKLLRSIYDMIDPDVYADKHKAFVMETFSGFFRMPYSNSQYDEGKQEAFDWIRDRNIFLMDKLEATDVTVQIADQQGDYILVIIKVTGHSAAKLVLNNLARNTQIDKGQNGTFSATPENQLLLYPGLIEDNDFFYEVVKDRRSPTHFLMPGAQQYLFKFTGLSKTQIKDQIAGAFSNAITGTVIKATIMDANNIDPSTISYNTVSQHAWSFPDTPNDIIEIGPGDIQLQKTLMVGQHQELQIKPGTTIRMGPGVSIISEGRVLMEGTLDQPITITRLNPERAWGVLALQGENASGSRISNAIISGGSTDTQLHVRYSGMVSVHWAQDIQMSKMQISSNSVGDDTLHIVHSDIVLQGLTLSDCFSDCIDLDYVDADITNITIYNAGNDGLDFMESNASLDSMKLINIGDKGISGGEGSTLRVSNAEFINAAIGVAAKDASNITITDTNFTQNSVALDVFAKNWRYGSPGKILAKNISWNNNEIDIRVADEGEIILRDSPVPERVIEDGGTIVLN